MQLFPQEQSLPHLQFSPHWQLLEEDLSDLFMHPQCVFWVHLQFWQEQLGIACLGPGAAERKPTVIREAPKKLNNNFMFLSLIFVLKKY